MYPNPVGCEQLQPGRKAVSRIFLPAKPYPGRLDGTVTPGPAARPGAYGSPPWTAAEDRLVRTLPPAQAAARTGRTMHAVYTRRHFLGLTGA